MVRKNSDLFLCILITFFIAFWSRADGATVIKEDLNIKFDKGKLSVDIRDIDVKVVFSALEEEGKIEIFNKKILPDRKISIKFNDLKTEKGIRKLMHACGVENYATIFTKGAKTGEPRVAKLILVKTGIGPAPIEKKIEVPIEKKIKATKVSEKEIEKAERETLIKTIMPMLEGVDEKTRQDIIDEIMEGELTILDED
ncbi:MAG: hypothetical protein LWX51_10960 [Deltaproteobacteria bacterium]|jgi:hypothetical protein|nr:hypothetical protein [Deltaproteobacteria bacterium]